ncbi:MAG: hypothetical protein ABJB76_05730 [Candidatus Nitrosocosmicus sp.]
MNAFSNGYFTPVLRFSPLVLIGAKINESFYLYDAGFGVTGKDRVKASEIMIVNKDYKAIGSGSKFAYLIFNQLNRLLIASKQKMSNLSLEVVIGLALYIVNKVKKIDPKCGEDTQIAIINKNGYDKISKKKYLDYYDKMIDKISCIIRNNSHF